MFDLEDPAGAVMEVNRCREAFPNHYIRVNAYDPIHGRPTIALQFMVSRPKHEPGFRLDRQEWNDRRIHDTLHYFAAEQPHGERYGSEGDESYGRTSAKQEHREDSKGDGQGDGQGEGGDSGD